MVFLGKEPDQAGGGAHAGHPDSLDPRHPEKACVLELEVYKTSLKDFLEKAACGRVFRSKLAVGRTREISNE
jgi:hypothetical protein